jgi:hypothetical protein
MPKKVMKDAISEAKETFKEAFKEALKETSKETVSETIKSWTTVDVLVGEARMYFDSDLHSTQEVEVLPDVDGDLIRLKHLSVDYNDWRAVRDYKVKCVYRGNEIVVASFDQRETPICGLVYGLDGGVVACNHVEVDVDELFGDLLCEKLVLSATGIHYQPGEFEPYVSGEVVFKYSGSVVRLG